MVKGYDVAQICPNGHVANSSYLSQPEFNQKYCGECGRATITSCPTCGAPIRGYYHHMLSSGFEPEKHCLECGIPYPWTQRAIEAAQALIAELDGLSSEEKSALAKSLDDIVCDTPMTPVSSLRFKRLVAKAGKESAAMLKDILIGIAGEAARRAVWG